MGGEERRTKKKGELEGLGAPISRSNGEVQVAKEDQKTWGGKKEKPSAHPFPFGGGGWGGEELNKKCEEGSSEEKK